MPADSLSAAAFENHEGGTLTLGVVVVAGQANVMIRELAVTGFQFSQYVAQVGFAEEWQLRVAL